MRSGLIFAAVASMVFTGGAGAQVAGQAQGSAAASANERTITDRYLTTVHAEMANKVDTKNAKVGQEVTARVTDDAQLADGTRLPKGTKLTGHVVAVQARTEQQAGALLALTFDQAELKGGQKVGLRSVLEMVSPPGGVSAAANANDHMGMGDGMGAGSMDANAGMNGRTSINPGGGGVLGGMGRGIGSSAGGAVPPLGSGDGSMDPTNPTNPMGRGNGNIGGIGGMGTQVGPDGLPGQSPVGATGPVGTRNIDTLGGGAAQTTGSISTMGVQPVVSAGENVSGTARPTGLPGVMLNRVNGASGLLTAFNRNITLDSGARVTMGLIAH